MTREIFRRMEPDAAGCFWERPMSENGYVCGYLAAVRER